MNDLLTTWKTWTKALRKPKYVIPLIVLVAPLVVNGWYRYTDRNPTLPVEQQVLANVLIEDQWQSKLCDLYVSGILQSQQIIESVANLVEDDPKCTSEGFVKDVPIPKVKGSNDSNATACLRKFKLETTSCRAYDKAGFHGRPSASCSMTLTAGEARFFAQEQVTVLMEAYRQQQGDGVLEAMQPNKEDGLVRAFSGTIACTNRRGTGRTCEARATVRAISYPDECKAQLAILKDAR